MVDRITLSEAFYGKIEALPDWIHKKNVIYLIENKINEHKYVGQTKYLLGRIRTYRGPYSHLFCYESDYHKKSYLYRAIKKYSPDSFYLSILESDIIDLDEREKYWINYYHTCIYDKDYSGGYNISSGGSGMNELIKYARQVNLELYPDTNGVCPEFIRAGHNKLKSMYPDTNGMPPACIKAGLLISNVDPDVIQRKTKGCQITRLINSISKCIDDLHRIDKELTHDNFKELTRARWCGYRGYKSIMNMLPELKQDPRWTAEMDKITSQE